MSIHSKVLEIDRRKELTHADTDYKYEDERRRDKQPKKNVSKFNEFEEEENDMSIPDELSNVSYYEDDKQQETDNNFDRFELLKNTLNSFTFSGGINNKAQQKVVEDDDELLNMEFTDEEFQGVHAYTFEPVVDDNEQIDLSDMKSNSQVLNPEIEKYNKPEKQQKKKTKENRHIKSKEIQNTDKERKLPYSVQTERILFNQSKNPNKSSKYFAEQNARSTPTDKYNRYAKHSYNVKHEKSNKQSSKRLNQNKSFTKGSMFGIKKKIMNISTSRLPSTSLKQEDENKYVLQRQFDAWRKSKNSSVLFPKENEDSFYNQNLKVSKLSIENEIKLMQSGEQINSSQRMIEPYSVTSKKLKKNIKNMLKSNFDEKYLKVTTTNSNQNSAFMLEKQAKMYANIENSIRQKKWLSNSMMNHRDSARQNSNK